MGLWLSFSILFVVILMFFCYMTRRKGKKYRKANRNHYAQFKAKESELQEKISELREKDSKLPKKYSENLILKEELLKHISGKDKLKENLEKYRKENKRLQEAAKKKRKQRSDAGKHRHVCPSHLALSDVQTEWR